MQLFSIYTTFNTHALASGESYTYPETTERKGADEVRSFIFHFIMNFLPGNEITYTYFAMVREARTRIILSVGLFSKWLM